MPREPVFGLLAEFEKADELTEAVRRAREAGFARLDAYSPFPIEGLAELLDVRDSRVPWLTAIGGILGAGLGYGLQVYTNLDFPIIVGARPLVAPPAFALITFELCVLFAVLFAIGGMLAINHLPRLNHPLFDVDGFELASRNRFFLVIFGNDAGFDRERTRQFLQRLRPRRVVAVESSEEPA
ncbi:MAG: DUF3341 domain-containing protein [Pseudomonadota bacterium]